MIIAEAIGLGLVASLLFTEAVGFAAGGFVVPGYIALYLDQPMRVVGTLLAAFITLVFVELIGLARYPIALTSSRYTQLSFKF